MTRIMIEGTRRTLFHSIIAIVILFQLNGINAKAIPIDRVKTEFIILHNNDMHARFEQTSADSGKCTPADENSQKCYGGFARVAHEVRKYRQEAVNGGTQVLYLNAGDTYTGTPWFTVFKDKIASEFLNKLQPDAISLGNHEFDENIEGLVPFLNAANFPVLTCNLDLTNTPELANTSSLANSTVLYVKGVQIGIIGYLTPETKFLVSQTPVEFKPEIDSINEEAAKMKADGINIIIALGHSGYQMDQEIAAKCPEVDIVIGGHTNTFLWNGTQPDTERIDGPYPTVIKQKSGKEVPVVQAYAYTKYLGRLQVQFDGEGNLLGFDGMPILLNATIPQDDDFLQLLEKYRPNITALENNVIGHTKVRLEGGSPGCRVKECNLGNLVTDSMVYARVVEDEGGVYWTDAAIAVVGGGGIRNSIEKRSDGSITEEDVLTVLPFKNDLYMTKVTGKKIRMALERSALLRNRDSNGGFLQMSGVRVTYDMSKDENERVVAAEVRCAECDVPDYMPLDDSKLYNVVVQKFLLDGGDGHDFEPESGFSAIRLKKNDKDALIQYFKKREFVYPEVENRITIIENASGRGAKSVMSSVIVISIAFLLNRFI